MSGAHFSPDLFHVLGELAENNQKEWFDANRDRYERHVREPALQFILDFGPRLRRISPHFRADPRKQGGSLFRIHRNRRFQPDAPPYKTHAGIQFRHDQGKDAHAPGFYLHLEPGGCFVGVGTWRPDSATLKGIRDAIVDDPEGWRAATRQSSFADHFELGGDSLKRGPRGFDRNHPLIDDLKRKDFIGVAEVSEADVTAPGFLDAFADRCGAAAPFVAWLCRAGDAPF